MNADVREMCGVSAAIANKILDRLASEKENHKITCNWTLEV